MTKLEQMLKYVSEHNDFYKKRIKEYGITNPLDITQWPILTRKELQENRYNMFSDGYKSKYFNQQLRRQSSSGSTGVPVNVYWDYKDWYASNLCLWRKRWEWYSIKPGDKYCVFTLNAFGVTPKDEKIYYINNPNNILSFNVSLIRDERGYEKMAEKINEFSPDWLYIQPFVLNQLIRAYKTLDIKPVNTIRYIESVGEILTSDLRRRAEGLFGISITNMYGSEEMNGIAIEDLNGDMHILDDNVFLETKNANEISGSGEGESIITNLNNYTMPLIRYAQGDDIVVRNSGLSLICGKQCSNLVSSNYRFNTLLLCEIIAELNNTYSDAIISYRYFYNHTTYEIKCELNILSKFVQWEKQIITSAESLFAIKTGASCLFFTNHAEIINRSKVKYFEMI